jgi:hypothetical protein
MAVCATRSALDDCFDNAAPHFHGNSVGLSRLVTKSLCLRPLRHFRLVSVIVRAIVERRHACLRLPSVSGGTVHAAARKQDGISSNPIRFLETARKAAHIKAESASTTQFELFPRLRHTDADAASAPHRHRARTGTCLPALVSLTVRQKTRHTSHVDNPGHAFAFYKKAKQQRLQSLHTHDTHTHA